MGKARFINYLLWAYWICTGNLLLAQMPPSGLEGQALRTWIRDEFFVSSHRTLNYSFARDSLLAFVDNRNDTIFSIYGGYPYYWPKGYVGDAPATQNNGNILDIEHTIPQSLYNESFPMVSDLHHLFPALQMWNSARSNFSFAEIPDQKTTKWMRFDQSRASIPTTDIDEYSELFERSFEPREDHKGNCARAIFYFFTVYPQSMYSSLEVNISSICDINTLYQWHIEDPVDSQEIQRNDDIERLQGNRNPFIDHPDWVVDAWGINKTPLTSPTNFQLLERPSSIELSWDDLDNEIRYYVYRSIDGADFERIASLPQDSTSYNDKKVELETIYYYYVVGLNGSGFSSPADTLSGKRADRNIFVDIFFSEYIEGSSLNKALEIANFTGEIVDLSSYSIKTQKNGSGVWESNFALSGFLDSERVWVIANSQAEESLLAKADTAIIGDIVSFNGNDVLGLFKNEQLIDIIGFELISDDFGKNITLVRDPSIYSPNIVYDPEEWEIFERDNIDNLGNHIVTSIFPKIKTQHLETFPNPVDNYLIIKLPDLSIDDLQDMKLSIFTHTGQKISLNSQQITQDTNTIRILLTNIPSGIYFLKVQNTKWVASGKIIKR